VQHIGIEVGDLLRSHRAGVARYTQCLLTALLAQPHSEQIFGWAPWRRLLGGLVHPAHVKVRFFGRSPPQTRPDIFHAAACVFPEWKSKIEVATVHDLYGIPALNKMTAKTWRRIAYIQRADRLICVSHFTRNHLHELLNVSPSRTIAIPLAAASNFEPATPESKRKLREKLRLPQEFFLFVGRDRYNKNLHRLVTAYARSGLHTPLCIAGKQDDYSRERLGRRARRYHCAGSIRWLGAVSDTELPVLFSCASALCMPSTFEGFGLPVIEAMACGTPVLTSADCATEEAAGGKAILVDPKSIDSIADGLVRVLQMTDAQRADARAYATRRTWSDVAAETMQLYRDMSAAALSVSAPRAVVDFADTESSM
jgi:glycosyltransferase involved in cell wall biosynthesis